VSASGFVYNRRIGLVVQQVTLINSTASTIAGPICLALENLSSNTSLANAAGTTVNSPVGSPFVIASSGDLAPGATLNVTLQFTLPSSGGITYAAHTVTGTATP
jgi:hypothetical protein